MRRTVELHAGAHELGCILVGRGHIDVEAGFGTLDRKRTHHIVGLEAVHAHDGDTKGLGQFEGVGNRGGEIFGHLLALGLIGFVGLVTEGRTSRIHRQDRVGGLFFLQD